MEKLVLATASPVMDSVVKKLGALRSAYADFEKLQDMLTTIQTGLDDAESKSITDKNLRRWLRKLRDAALDAEDVVEEFETEALRRRIERCDRMAGKVRDFFSSIVFRCKMVSKIKGIRNRLDAIDQESKRFQLLSKSSSPVLMDRETSSLVVESEIYGRDEDEKKVMKFLIDGDNDKNISVLPIFGLGGVGKTTLAQIVYNKDRVKEQFELRMWVCVGENFDVKVVSQKMIEQVKGEPSDHALIVDDDFDVRVGLQKMIEQVRGEPSAHTLNLDTMLSFLQEKMSARKFLLVIDDLWIKNSEWYNWDRLKPLFNQAKLGSKIIITTRFENVAHMTGTVSPYRLKELQSDDCWTIFRKRAFRVEKEEENPELVEIGKEIIEKCGGLPLAAKALGSLMSSKKEKIEWQAIRDDHIWKLSIDEIGVIPALKLSYDNLPSPLKRCFTYCSMFPKHCFLNIDNLIQFWMAEGFIDTSNTSLHAEDIGKQYFNNLQQRSFFQDVEMDVYNNLDNCQIHDLVHELACSLAKDESWLIKKGNENIPSGCRYLLIQVHDLASNHLKTIFKAKKLRSLVLLHLRYLGMPEFMFNIHEFIFNVTKNLTQLHVLILNYYETKKLPDGISKLKHLRLLDLSNTSITSLPSSITRLYNLQILNLYNCAKLKKLPEGISTLYNLQTLDLYHCEELQKLPEGISTLHNLQTLNLSYCCKLQKLPQDISSLINLRHLDISGCRNMSSIPHRLGQLTNLQTLGIFIVAEENGRTIMELQHLNSIQGSLKIRGLQHVKDPNEAMHANLKIKKRLDRLELQWENGLDETQEPSSTNVVEEVLERLRPHDYLKELIIDNYMGSRLPTWMSSSLSKLVKLHLRGLERCGCLLPLGQLPLLKKLNMVGMHAIRRIGEEFYGDGGDSAFPPLEVLYLKNMPNLEEWNTEPTIAGRKMTTFLHLTKLSIISCPKLMVQPSIPCSVEDLAIRDSHEMLLLEGSLAGLSKLKKLDIDTRGVSPSSLSEWWDGLQCSISLAELKIRSCDEQTTLPEGIIYLPSLCTLCLYDFKNLSLNWEGRKQQQPTPFFAALQCLTIENSELTALPEWIGGITSLYELHIQKCPKLAMLPDGLRQLTALQSLNITGADELIALPEWIGGITSLYELHIQKCPKLAMLPDGLRQLTALQYLSIDGCPQLAKRCKRETGEDWHKIAHIRVHDIMLEEGLEEEDRREADGEENSKICTFVAKFLCLFGLACCIGNN